MFITMLIFLILLAAFFSMAETGMMAVNRYRMRHLSRKSHVNAARVLKLLERPDRLLGLVLIGNTFANIFVSAIVTILAMRWFGETGAFIATFILTVVMLIFGEIAPKTLAALFSQRVALWVATPLQFLLKLFYPLVWAVNGLANGMLRLVGVQIKNGDADVLSIDELRSIVHEAAGKTKSPYQAMLLRVLDLQQITVQEVMVPKNEIYGIDLEQDWDTIVKQIRESIHTHLPMYHEHIDRTRGMLVLRCALVKMTDPHFDKAALLALAEDIYFIPESAQLHQQLLNFQHEKQKIGLVVDEYGAIQGVLTLRDLLAEIIGDIAMNAADIAVLVIPQKEGGFLVDGSITIRDLNRLMDWHFPINGPRTLSGLMIDYLESIPKAAICARIAGYPLEVVSVSSHTILQVRIWPILFRAPK